MLSREALQHLGRCTEAEGRVNAQLVCRSRGARAPLRQQRMGGDRSLDGSQPAGANGHVSVGLGMRVQLQWAVLLADLYVILPVHDPGLLIRWIGC